MTTPCLSPSEATADLAPTHEPRASGRCRVLHFINGEHYSGAERVQDLLAEHLPQFGVEAGFVCVKPGRFPEQRRAQHVPLFSAPMRNRFDVWTGLDLVRVVREGGYDLLHAHTPRSALVASRLARKLGLPFAYHVHSPTARDTTHWLRNWLNDLVERSSLREAARLITVSESLADDLRQRGYLDGIIRVVPNGVPGCQAAPRDPPAGRWTLGMVALFRPRKGIEVLLHALAQLRQQGRDVVLRAVGPFETPHYEAGVKALVERLGLTGAVTWTGYTRNVNAELQQLDLFVLPSLFGEGLPMVVLESMAAGVPVVATRVEGTPEAVRDGVEGVLAEPDDPADLARAIGLVLRGELDWSALSHRARARHAARFSAERMAEGVAHVYRELA